MNDATTLRFKIGPAVIAIAADTAPHDWPHPFYGPFESTGEERPTVTIRVRSDPPPARGQAPLTGELATQWQVYTQENGLRLEILEQKEFQPRQVALVNPAWDHVDVCLIPYDQVPTPQTRWYLGSVMEPLVQWWLTARLALRAEGMLLHGSAVLLESRGLAFIGPSGAGKTTIARWCRDEAGAKVLSDERILIWRDGGAWRLAGTPWYGELHEVSPAAGPLTRLFFLSKAAGNRFVPWKTTQLLGRLLPEVFVPIWSPEGMEGLIRAGVQLARDVSSGALEFVNASSIVSYVTELINAP